MMECKGMVHQSVCVQAGVTIRPHVEVGRIRCRCLGGPHIGACSGELLENCTFTVSQRICVELPLEFSAIAVAEPSGITCDTPATGPCRFSPQQD